MDDTVDSNYYLDLENHDSLFGSPVQPQFTPGRPYHQDFSFTAVASEKVDKKGVEEISPSTVVKSSAVVGLSLPKPATPQPAQTLPFPVPATTQPTQNPTPPALGLDIPPNVGDELFVSQDQPADTYNDVEYPDLSYLVPQSAISQLINNTNISTNLWDTAKPPTTTQAQYDFNQWAIPNNGAYQYPDPSAYQYQQQQPIGGFQPIYYQQPQSEPLVSQTYNSIPTTPRRSPQNSRKHPSTFSDSSSIILNPFPSPIPLTVAKKIEHKRRLKNAEDNRPQDVYKQRPPRSKWGPFRYQDLGVELYPLLYFTSDQIVDFITNREANKKRKLTIWIQNAPAQVNNRYHMGTNSSKCRWAHCPGPKNTILKGFWRVAFDEDSNVTGNSYDPFFNAGYMHLFCFEELFNLGFMLHASRYLGFKVEADVRDFPYESRNPMSIKRDHEALLEVYKKFVAVQRTKYPVLEDEGELQRLGRQWIKGTAFSPVATTTTVPAGERLWRQLTDAHLANEVATRHATRENRGGANIGQHRGDLRMYMQLKKAGGAPIDAASLGLPPPLPAAQKRKREVMTIEDDEDGQQYQRGGGGDGQQRSSQRMRRTHTPSQLVIPNQPQSHLPQVADEHRDGEYDLDSAAMPPPQPQYYLPKHMTTRRASKVAGSGSALGERESEIIMDVITSPVRMTRRTSQALQTRLHSQPRFVQKQVLAVIPEHMKEIFNSEEEEMRSSKHELAERLARLPRHVRFEVDEFAKKRERAARELASF